MQTQFSKTEIRAMFSELSKEQNDLLEGLERGLYAEGEGVGMPPEHMPNDGVNAPTVAPEEKKEKIKRGRKPKSASAEFTSNYAALSAVCDPYGAEFVALMGYVAAYEIDDFVEALNAAGKKDAELAIDTIKACLGGNKDKISERVAQAIRVLKADGKIVSGKEGNLYKSYIASGKTETTAVGYVGHISIVLQLLGAVEKVKGKGEYIANSDNFLLK